MPFFNLSWQPSEFVKITFMVCFALHLAYLKDKINKPSSVLQLALHAGLIIGLVAISDFGMALVYVVIAAFMIFASGMSLWYFLGAGAAVVMASPFLWQHLSEKQQRRILVGFNPGFFTRSDKGLQQIRSRTCIIAGGFRGAGFSGGSKYYSLPEGQSDCLFAVLAEKFGFIGTFLYIVLIITLVLRILWIAKGTRKKTKPPRISAVGIAGPAR